MSYIFKEKTHKIIGACFEVHKELGHGYQEAAYQEAIEIELKARKIPFIKEAKLTIDYKGIELRKKHYTDFICYDEVILEIKAVSNLIDEHLGQVLNYLKTADLKLGLLINFGAPSLEVKRIIR